MLGQRLWRYQVGTTSDWSSWAAWVFFFFFLLQGAGGDCWEQRQHRVLFSKTRLAQPFSLQTFCSKSKSKWKKVNRTTAWNCLLYSYGTRQTLPLLPVSQSEWKNVKSDTKLRIKIYALGIYGWTPCVNYESNLNVNWILEAARLRRKIKEKMRVDTVCAGSGNMYPRKLKVVYLNICTHSEAVWHGVFTLFTFNRNHHLSLALIWVLLKLTPSRTQEADSCLQSHILYAH